MDNRKTAKLLQIGNEFRFFFTQRFMEELYMGVPSAINLYGQAREKKMYDICHFIFKEGDYVV